MKITYFLGRLSDSVIWRGRRTGYGSRGRLGCFAATVLLTFSSNSFFAEEAFSPPVIAAAAETAGRAQPGWRAPVAVEIEVVKDFEKPEKRWSTGHRGVDLAAPSGAVYAPANGKVVFSGKVVDRTVITLEHSGGVRTTYEPVANPLPVGTEVAIGEQIAEIDESVDHCAVRCLHWGAYRGSGNEKEYLNPLLLVGLGEPSVLLPIGEDFSA